MKTSNFKIFLFAGRILWRTDNPSPWNKLFRFRQTYWTINEWLIDTRGDEHFHFTSFYLFGDKSIFLFSYLTFKIINLATIKIIWLWDKKELLHRISHVLVVTVYFFPFKSIVTWEISLKLILEIMKKLQVESSWPIEIWIFKIY